jgi:septal ring factor EnvC (AmiA/AmiB activator)
MQKKDLARLNRILGLLGSDHPGERASAALAATNFLKKHDMTWDDVLGGAAQSAAVLRRHRLDPSDDDLKAAESRLRQMKAHNDTLERQLSRLKTLIEDLRDQLGGSPLDALERRTRPTRR